MLCSYFEVRYLFGKYKFYNWCKWGGTCAIISTYRFNDLEPDQKYEVIKTAAMHEIGHVFEISNNDRKTNVENNIGWHCTNKCVMRQKWDVTGWIEMTNDRIKGEKPLCDECINDLFILKKIF